MGFGHRVYANGDPRSPIIKEYSKFFNFLNRLFLKLKKVFYSK